jgi:hypothetical protein
MKGWQNVSKKKKQRNTSTIKDHIHRGKTLTPPLAALPGVRPTSWMNERLPEMLWAALLIAHAPRQVALATFRQVAHYVSQFTEGDTIHDVTLSGLARAKPDLLQGFLKVIVATDAHRAVLTPLLLLHGLPAREAWAGVLNDPDPEEDWSLLTRAVAVTIDHQSQEATDCRWVRLMCLVSSGKIIMPPESVKEIGYYPNYGDMRHVRPGIRAAEIMFWDEEDAKREWPEQFWAQCLSDTPCFPLPFDTTTEPVVGTTPEQVKHVYHLLVEHNYRTTGTSLPDARHETVFGIGLYCLSILQELLRIGASQSITARIALRTIVESFISLAYLATKDDPQLWKSYRVFGAGQAKLSYLKLDEMESESSFVDIEALKRLANEDIWEEFLPIELGHWEKSNLRKISEDAGVKNEYDRFYGWTSTFAHGHWGALRDSVYDTCGNALHRLHRIPRESPRSLPDVLPDACLCVDKILEVVSGCYPDFPHRVTQRTDRE